MASVLDLIGETPLVEVTTFDRGPCRLFLKLEKRQSVGLDQGSPGRHHDRGGGSRRPAETGRHHRRGDGRQYGSWSCAGRRPQGLPAHGRRARQDGREKICIAAMGAEVVLTRSDVGAAIPSTIRTSPRRSRGRPARSTRTSSRTRRTRAHETDRPGNLAADAGQDRRVLVGVGSGGTVTGMGKFMEGVAREAR